MRRKIPVKLSAILLVFTQQALSQNTPAAGWDIIEHGEESFGVLLSAGASTDAAVDSISSTPSREQGAPIIEQYGNGFWVRIRVGTPGSPHQSLGEDDNDVVALLAEYIPEIDRYQLEGLGFFDSLFSDAPMLSEGHFQLKQNLDGDPSFGIDIRRLDAGEAHISGLIVDPDTPEVQSDNWLSEADAMALVREALEQYVDSGAVMATSTIIEAYVDDGSIVVVPLFLAETPEAIVRVNLYTGEVTSHATSDIFASYSEVKTIACRPGTNSSSDHCRTHPDTYAVFQEDNAGNGVCTSGEPWNNPTAADCAKLGYQNSFKAVQESEHLMDTHFPNDCCTNMGRNIQVPGCDGGTTTVNRIDVLLNSPGSAITFSPGQKRIKFGSTYTNSTSTGGWESSTAHEWAHAYQDYFGSPDTGGFSWSGHTSSQITAASIAEGLADVWAVILNAKRITNQWNWSVKRPNGTLIRTIPHNFNVHTQWSHSSGQIHENGKMVSALFRQMHGQGLSDSNKIRMWKSITRNLRSPISIKSDGVGPNSQTNLFDFAGAYRDAVQEIPSSQRDSACHAWHANTFKLGLYDVAVCGPERVDRLQPYPTNRCVQGTLGGVTGIYSEWVIPFDQDYAKGSYVEFQHRINALYSWQTSKFADAQLSANGSDIFYTASTTGLPSQIRAKTCNWDIDDADQGAAVCTSWTSNWEVYDYCTN